MCHEVVDAEAKSYDIETKAVPTNFNEKIVISVKQKKLYILSAFL